jgi:hypothetical protein
MIARIMGRNISVSSISGKLFGGVKLNMDIFSIILRLDSSRLPGVQCGALSTSCGQC